MDPADLLPSGITFSCSWLSEARDHWCHHKRLAYLSGHLSFFFFLEWKNYIFRVALTELVSQLLGLVMFVLQTRCYSGEPPL